MSIVNTLYEHANFGGFSKTTFASGYRYYWNRWGATNDVFSSMKTSANGGRGHAFAFEHIDFNGRLAALTVGYGYQNSWWSYFGDAFNDKVSSSLIITREAPALEVSVPLRSFVAAQFTSLFDAETNGTALSRSGEPKVYATYFPSYDSQKVFATIDQDLSVAIDWWPDYSANVRYDIRFYLHNGRLHGYAAWSHVWVESGLLSGSVHDKIAPQLHGAKDALTSAIGDALAAFDQQFRAVYLLPGTPDATKFGYFANYDDDVTLVVAR